LTKARQPIDGHWPCVLAVRDLASALQLAWRALLDMTVTVSRFRYAIHLLRGEIANPEMVRGAKVALGRNGQLQELERPNGVQLGKEIVSHSKKLATRNVWMRDVVLSLGTPPANPFKIVWRYVAQVPCADDPNENTRLPCNCILVQLRHDTPRLAQLLRQNKSPHAGQVAAILRQFFRQP
jgi:hypothetical protein